MRYFILLWALVVAVIMIVAGRRGDLTRRPPVEIWPDMDRQPKLRPQAANKFFGDGLSSQLPVEGTVSRGSHYELNDVNTGRRPSAPGTTNFVDLIPVPITESLIARGQERFTIYCAPCHGQAGDGKGITTKYGMSVIANLHDQKGRKLITMPDGEIFNTISNGKNLMGGYAGNIPVEDRWAIVAWVRVLQRSQLGGTNDLTTEQLASLLNKK